jgi:hypothetical protein
MKSEQWTLLAKQAEHVDHLNHGVVPHLPKEVREAIRVGLLQGKGRNTVLADVKAAALTLLQHAHQFESLEATLEALHNKEIPVNRQYLTTRKDVDNVAADLERAGWRFTKNDQQNVRLAFHRQPENYVHYQEQNGEKTFCVCLMHPWQEKMLLKHGHGGVILMDATFGTNNCKVSPHISE